MTQLACFFNVKILLPLTVMIASTFLLVLILRVSYGLDNSTAGKSGITE